MSVLDQDYERSHLRHLEILGRIRRVPFELWGTRQRCEKDVKRTQRYMETLMTKWRVVLQGRKTIIVPPGVYMPGAIVGRFETEAEAKSCAAGYVQMSSDG